MGCRKTACELEIPLGEIHFQSPFFGQATPCICELYVKDCLLFALCSVIGTPFYIMSYVPGRVLKDPGLPGLQPSQRKVGTLSSTWVDW